LAAAGLAPGPELPGPFGLAAAGTVWPTEFDAPAELDVPEEFDVAAEFDVPAELVPAATVDAGARGAGVL
jgi:hypothetical protein